MENCKQTVLFKLLPEGVDGSQVIAKYSHRTKAKGDEWLERLRQIQKQQDNWVEWRSKYEDEKMRLGQNKQYSHLGRLLAL